MSNYIYTRNGRRPATAVTVVVVWVLLGLAMVLLDASIWVAGLGVLATLPALFDLVTARVSSLLLSDTDMGWQSGKRTGGVPLAEIQTVRLDTRLDMSIKATLIRHSGASVRLPLDVVPPAQSFEDALNARGIKVERHHFRLIG
ncbi:MULTISPECIES: hypothetical protein [Roseobacteraceae]|jgi:hypothetical protein|uniref:Uncharacterized protein n=1 Tax=Pseudosulfitobacter pseudonitzschiae TaxID=1402135 RepID=A0A221K138_9RHOB|nr:MULTISPECIES: hypothetical protein [Roseobacteraceae]ASM72722.1 hypothetical protein SULPSESMR1_01914 [Pseudosulfitobacter pseudonitzschiae]